MITIFQDVYETFNILMRRKPKENNFKAVLETIRELMNTECVVPDWLHDIILGYGDPGAAHYSRSVPYLYDFRLSTLCS
jgi:intron-binding protein aquarius